MAHSFAANSVNKNDTGSGDTIKKTVAAALTRKYPARDYSHIFDNIDNKTVENSAALARSVIKENVRRGTLSKEDLKDMPYLYGGLTLFYAANEKNNTKAANLSHALAYTKQAASDIYNTQVPKSVSQNNQVSENYLSSVPNYIIQDAADYLYDAYDTFSKKHFEERNVQNSPLPTYEEAKTKGSGWLLCDEKESIFHDNGKGEKEKKYVHPDGREVVFDGDTFEVITDPELMGTYNYGKYLPEDSYEKTVLGTMDYAVDGISHFWHDVLPYLIFLKSNTREEFETKIKPFLDYLANAGILIDNSD